MRTMFFVCNAIIIDGLFSSDSEKANHLHLFFSYDFRINPNGEDNA